MAGSVVVVAAAGKRVVVETTGQELGVVVEVARVEEVATETAAAAETVGAAETVKEEAAETVEEVGVAMGKAAEA